MSLQFVFGPSGAGKSQSLYQEILRQAEAEKQKNFLIIVPDQFTMQTQKDLVTLSERGGILNIDVLSFGRLSHRILEEVGCRELPVLDDTGKSLVLQKVAAGLKEELPALGSFLHRQGYIHEVKSAISEFMQYGIRPEDVDQLIAHAAKRGALVQKLQDLKTIYRGFTEYIHGNFITTEETLDLVRRSLHKSKLLPDSVVVFDGFTGFTPIQNRLIQELMTLCGQVIVTVTLGEGEDPYKLDGEQKLFYLSKKTVRDLEKLAQEAGVSRREDVFITAGARFREAPALAHLEQQVFRYEKKEYAEKQQEVQIFQALTPREEVHQAAQLIRELVQKENMAYRDIAVITGELEGYAPYVENEFAQLEIPCFVDRTRGIVLNPMIEYIKSALELYLKDFSYQAVFHYLRSGMTDLSREEIDVLENYVLETGICGYHKWSRLFTRKTARMDAEEEGPLQQINGLRQQFMEQVELLRVGNSRPAKEYVEVLHEFLVKNKVQQKLGTYEASFTEHGDLSRAREYAQIYRLVMELMDQIHGLLGEEVITLQEFADIIEAGFGEIQVGILPQNVDRVVVGDMERTRLKQVKALFFLGVNDGNIPKSASKGGIISDIDREFLLQSGMELAPSPRQQMYIQRLYLYLNLTKPSHKLFLSYARMGSDGKSLRPAYLIDMVKELFPGTEVSFPEGRSFLEQMVAPGEGMRYLAEELREYAAGTLSQEKEKEFFTIYAAYGEEWKKEQKLLTEAAFLRYRDKELSRAVARALYGWEIHCSVTRLETYAACAYRHFLQYGLKLKEREEFGFEAIDLGNVYHGVLERFGAKLEEQECTWFDFSEEFARAGVHEALESYGASYGSAVLYSSARNQYAMTRMERVLVRTVLMLQKQLKKGMFLPTHYEVSFSPADGGSIQIPISEKEKLHLWGRIDRVDVAEDEKHVYVKVIDYKSGAHDFDLAAFYHGLQLQLVMYMNAALEMEAKENPGKEAVPAAMLYYQVADPAVETPVELSEEELEETKGKALCMTGLVNSDLEVVERLDRAIGESSGVIPVKKNKDGSFSANSRIMNDEELKILSRYANKKIGQMGREILRGRISLNPYQSGGRDACTYCPYGKVCGFDQRLPDCKKRSLEKWDKVQFLEKMKEE